jgi:hypothetical protein
MEGLECLSSCWQGGLFESAIGLEVAHLAVKDCDLTLAWPTGLEGRFAVTEDLLALDEPARFNLSDVQPVFLMVMFDGICMSRIR